VIRFKDVEIDTSAMRVTRGGEPVALEPRAFDLLVYLAGRPGQLVEKEVLIRDVWRGTAVTDNAITRVIAQIRRAIGDTAHEPRFIETVPTRGYRFVAPLEATEGSSVGTASGPGSEPVPPVAARVVDPHGGVASEDRGRRALVGLAAMLLLGGAAAAGWWLTRGSGRVDSTLSAADLPFSASFPTQLTVSSGLDLFPAVSPDGMAVAYASDRTGRFEIVVRALGAAGGERLLTGDGLQNVQPAWSPDGQFIAYHARVPGGIWIVSSQGGTPRQVSPFGSAPAWSPDGAQLAFQSVPLTDLGPTAGAAMPPSTIWVASRSGGEPRPLTQPGQPIGGHGRPIWFPDGTRLLFVNGGPTIRDMWSVPASGGPASRLVTCEASCLDPFLGPDGHLYYTDGQLPRVWRVELDAAGKPRARARPLTVPVGGTIRGVSIAKSGRVAAFATVEIRSNLYSVGIDAQGRPTGEPRAVTDDRSRRNTWPTVSPDGHRIAYVAGRTGASPNVWVVNRDGSAPEQMTVDFGHEGGAMWSADGRSIYYKTWRNGRLVMRAVDVSTRRQRDVLTFDEPLASAQAPYGLQAFTLRTSRDGTKLAFAGFGDRVPNVFAADVAGRVGRQLTHDREGISFPVFSPAGDWLAVQLYRDGATHAGVVAAGGGDVRQITATPGQTWVHDWSPDSAFISAATLRNGVWNIAAVSRATGAEQRLTRDVTPRTYVRYPAWSPSGDFIVYERAEITGNIWTSELSARPPDR
jgi:Tol biopolymer transport system component/DNA-binding winged helix-turn-helix (wHTH) protein